MTIEEIKTLALEYAKLSFRKSTAPQIPSTTPRDFAQTYKSALEQIKAYNREASKVTFSDASTES